jgi:acetyltransferase
MSVHHLDKMFHPESVAVIGADSKPGSIGFTLIKNLVAGGFEGKILPIHPGLEEICGIECRPSVSDLNERVDLVLIAASPEAVPEILARSGRAGIPGAVLMPAGNRKPDFDSAISKEAKQFGIRILGPDSIGIITGPSRMNASLSGHMPLPGSTALISQSGSVGTAILDLSVVEKTGFSFFVSLGMTADVDFGDVIDFLGGEETVDSIVIYLEHLKRVRQFMSAARSVSRVKPIIALKAGRTGPGAKAAAGHTGRGAGEDAVYDAAFRRAGIVRVRTFEELFDCAELLAKRPRPALPGLAIVTNAGGPGVMATDALADHGSEPVALSSKTVMKLDAVLPSGWSRTNPIDILVDASPERYRHVMEICLNADEIDGILIILSPNGLNRPTEVAETLVNLLAGTFRPVVTSWMGGSDVEAGRRILNGASIPTFDTPERAVRAFMDVYRHSENQILLRQIPSALPARLSFDREKAEGIISSAVQLGPNRLPAAALKDLFTAYGLCDETSGKESFSHSAPEPGSGFELRVGVKTDPDFGPVIRFGPGGFPGMIWKEHAAMALPPLNRILAGRLIQRSRVHRLLTGENGKIPSVDPVSLEEILIRVSQLVSDFSEIDELEIHPLVVSEAGFHIRSAWVSVRPPKVRAPHHLAISPYPNQYETRVETRDGESLFVRPIRPEDAALLQQMFEALSVRSVYYRFLSPLRQLNHALLARFTQIDYDREIALVAIRSSPGGEQIVGVGRIITEPNQIDGEFAILVSDALQGKGVGAALLQHCLDIARQRGLQKVWGIVLPQNTQMLALGEKLGFQAEKKTETGDLVLSIHL